MLFHDMELFAMVTYRASYQQDYCSIEKGVRFSMDLAGEYYFGRLLGRGITALAKAQRWQGETVKNFVWPEQGFGVGEQ